MIPLSTIAQPSTHPSRMCALALVAVCAAGLHAADNDVRIVPELLFGTSGVEPGLAFEVAVPWKGPKAEWVILRPEVLISDDGRLGAGFAVLYDLTSPLSLPERHAMAIGPRVVYHNSHNRGLEADVMGTWSYEIAKGQQTGSHHLGLLGALGVVDNRRADSPNIAITAGVFYAYQF